MTVLRIVPPRLRWPWPAPACLGLPLATPQLLLPAPAPRVFRDWVPLVNGEPAAWAR
jgi:hypothetical protein